MKSTRSVKAFVVCTMVGLVCCGTLTWSCAGFLISEELIGAAYDGRIDDAKWLLSRGANVNFQFEDGTTPIAAAASNGHLEMIQFLMSRGADPTIQDHDGLDAFDKASNEIVQRALRSSDKRANER